MLLTAKYGHVDAMKILIDNKTDFTITDKKGFSPLEVALKYGN